MTYGLHDDNGTPDDESDDVVVGWMVMELYDVSLFGGTVITVYFDLDSNSSWGTPVFSSCTTNR